MPSLQQAQIRNCLLRALPQEEFELLAPFLRPVSLPLRHVLVHPNRPTSSVCFVESGLASVVASSGDGVTVEVGHVGREGMTGFHMLHMTNRTPNKTFMQASGEGFQLDGSRFSNVLDQSASLRAFFLRYLQTCETQLAQSAVANSRYLMHQRLARWLLMCHDRLGDGHMMITHEFLSLMLGVRRASVTDQIHLLEGERAIKATRGNVRIIDRAKLEEIAGGCYGIAEREYERLVGISPRG